MEQFLLGLICGLTIGNLILIFRKVFSKDYSEKELKQYCVNFFYHWWNTPGNNTEEGFDKWFEQNKK